MRLLAAVFLLAGCSSEQASSDARNRSVARPAARAKLPVDGRGAIAIDAVRAAARGEAARLFGAQCDQIKIPDRAFVPIEINGDDRPEYAVLLGRATCAFDGNPPSANQWLGTGGADVMIWYATGWPPTLLLHHQMHGFTPLPDGLLSLQHGGFCPNGTGPNVCLVRYKWNDREQDLEPVKRTLYDGAQPDPLPRMRYEYEQISR